MTIRWSETAGDALEDLHGYIALHGGRTVAAEIVHSLCRLIERLQSYPRMGRAGRVAGTSELSHPPYVIVYQIAENVINIVDIFDGRRQR